MLFFNRTEAGQILATRLKEYANREDVIVLGIPRGGVPVAFEVATSLDAPLDVLVLRKLGVPDHEELALGAIASGGVRVLDRDIIEALEISDLDVELVTAKETKELERRERTYRAGRLPLRVKGKIVILIDDGIATGSSIRAAIIALRRLKPARIVIASPVASIPAWIRLRSEADEVVCVQVPASFAGVGQFYSDFSQVADEEVKSLLDRAPQPVAAT